MIFAAIANTPDFDRVVDWTFLIIIALLLVWWFALTATARIGRSSKNEDEWMDRHIAETTASTGRRIKP